MLIYIFYIYIYASRIYVCVYVCMNVYIHICMHIYVRICVCIMSSSSVICQTTGPKPLPKRFLHVVRSRASSFNWQYPLLSLRPSSSFLRLLPRLLVTSICPFIFPSITFCRRQSILKMWPIQLAFRFLISCRIFLCSLTLSNTSSFLTWSVQLTSPSFSSTTFQNFPGFSDLLPGSLAIKSNISCPSETKPFYSYFLYPLLREPQYSTYVIEESFSFQEEKSWLSGITEVAFTPIYLTHVFLHSLPLVTCEPLFKMDLVSLGIAFPSSADNAPLSHTLSHFTLPLLHRVKRKYLITYIYSITEAFFIRPCSILLTICVIPFVFTP